MKNLINKLLFGKDRFSGVLALIIISLIALGCTCGKDFDLANIGKEESNTTRTAANTEDSNEDPFGTPATQDKTSTTKADASTGEVPSDEQLQDLVKTTLLDFNAAVMSEDFTEFHSNICKPWQKQTTPESLKSVFQGFIDKNITIGSISSLDAEFSPEPTVGREVGFKTLKLKGKYPTSPRVTKFELNYIPEGKEWKLSKIEIDTTSTE